MDPELAKLLTVLASSALAVSGTLAGAFIGARGAARVAQINVTAQREIARDADRRKRKSEQSSHLLDLANGRIRLYRQFHNDALLGRTEGYYERTITMRDSHVWDEASWIMMASAKIREAIQVFSQADTACQLQVHEVCRLLTKGVDMEPSTADLMEKIGALSNVLVFVNQVVEDYVDGYSDTPEEREAERTLAEIIRRKTLGQ